MSRNKIFHCAYFSMHFRIKFLLLKDFRSYNATLMHVRVTTVAVEKNVLHILSVCVALGTQHAMRMCHIVICDLSGSAIFFHISHKWNFFLGGGVGLLLNIKRVC